MNYSPELHNAVAGERSQTCVILAGGPSLKEFVKSSFEGNIDDGIGYLVKNCKNFITINDSWRLLPNGTKAVNYFCDAAWWSMQVQKNPRSVDGLTSFHDMIYRGNWITGSNDPVFTDHPQVNVLKLTGQRGLELDRGGLRHGSNSGYQAINLAVHLGAKRIVLLGYDMKVDSLRTNWHNEVRTPAHAYAATIQQSMLPHFPSLIEPLKDLGVEVINATPNSDLTCFPMMSLEDALRVDPKLISCVPGQAFQKSTISEESPFPVWEDEMLDWRS